jgi:hypothetical protein
MAMSMSDVVSLAISLLALAIAIWTWWQGQKAGRTELTELNKIVLDNPEFNSQAWCEASIGHPDDRRRNRYDVFAQMIWDYVEYTYLEFGERALERSPVYGVAVYFASIHKAWLHNTQASFPYYGEKFVMWVKRLPAPEGPVASQQTFLAS